MSETNLMADEAINKNNKSAMTLVAPVTTTTNITITGATTTSQLPRSRSGSTTHSSASGASSSSSVSFNESATHSTSSIAPAPTAINQSSSSTSSTTHPSSSLINKPIEKKNNQIRPEDQEEDDDVLGYLTVSETARPPSSIPSSKNVSDESAMPIIVTASARSRRHRGKNGASGASSHQSINGRIRNVFEVIRSRFNNAQTKPATSSVPDKTISTASLSSSSSQDSSDCKKSKKSSSSKKEKLKKPESKSKEKNNTRSAHKEQIDLKPMTNNSLAHKAIQSSSSIGDQHRLCDHHHQMTTLCELCYNECSLEDKKDGRLNFIYALDTCEHSFCLDCLRQYLKYQIIESRVAISCPKCSEKMHPNEIYNILSYNNVEVDRRDSAEVINAKTASCDSHGSESENNDSDMLLKSSKVKNKSRGSQPTAIGEKAINVNEYKQLIRKYEEFMVRRVLVTIADTRWCPAPDCTYAVIATGCANCPQLFCQRPGCNTSFCYHCKQYWHPNLTCEDAAIRSATNASGNNSQGVLNAVSVANLESTLIQAAVSNTQAGAASTNKIFRSFWHRSNSHLSTSSSQLAASSSGGPTSSTSNNNNSSNIVVSSRSGAAALLAAAATGSGDWMKEEIKRCPKCLTLIVKMDDGSCNHITCSVCGCEFCWLCMKEISDLHYLSPSGCTFWGKKPWSRKKKIMWQLGTLIGAPVGIALIAGVAVPAILIGLPIWSGRKVYVRYKTIGKHKRNLIVVGTVAGTVLVAPLVAALAVGIGVPILLAYVYGVVPISLCRSGGCGVTKNNNGGVRFAFDDEVATSSNAYSNNNNNNEGNSKTGFTSVTIPISAIEPRHASDKSDKTSGHQQQQQTPVLVTITMANNGSSSKSVKPTSGSSASKSKRHHRHQRSSSRGKHHRHEKTASSVSSSSVANQGAVGTTSSSLIEKTANVRSSASITCGLVDEQTSSKNKLIMTNRDGAGVKNRTPELDEETAASETGTAAAAILQRLTKSIHSDNLSASSLISASMQGLEDQIVKEADEEPSIEKSRDIPTASKQASPGAKGNIIVKMVSQRTGGLSAASNSRPSKMTNQNPSIGEMSIGIASLSAGNSVDQVDYALESVNLVDETLKNKTFRVKTGIAEAAAATSNTATLNDPLDRADRDSTSNKAVASINSVRVDLNECGMSECGSRLDSRRSTSCTTYNKSLLGVDLEACSASIISEKSMNPSVSALAGSIKDNQSISNYSEK